MTEAFDLLVRPDHARVKQLRDEIRRRLAAVGVADDLVDRVVLVVDEIVSNSIEHGEAYRAENDRMSLRIEVVDGYVGIEFVDSSVPAAVVEEVLRLLEACRGERPPIDSERGRGLFLIDDGLDELEIRAAPGGTGLVLRGRLLRETG